MKGHWKEGMERKDEYNEASFQQIACSQMLSFGIFVFISLESLSRKNNFPLRQRRQVLNVVLKMNMVEIY